MASPYEELEQRASDSNNLGNQATPICAFTSRPGGCYQGARCQYSHDTSNLPTKPLQRREETPEYLAAKAKLNAWRRHIKNEPRSNDFRTIELLWSGALKILDGGERDCVQFLVRDLDDDEYYGHHHIDEIMSMRSGTADAPVFIKLVKPFLNVITHRALLDSLAVSTAVGGLYNLMGGSHGNKLISFLQHLCSNLVTANEISEDSSDLTSTLRNAIVSLRELLKREQRARYNDDLEKLISTFDEAGQALELVSSALHASNNVLAEIRAMTSQAKSRLNSQEVPVVNVLSTTTPICSYPKIIRLPNDRHDNDKMDITDISIFPTEEEIRSDVPEYLPSTDPNQPHFLEDLSARHLDTHFRLYRHDIFGQLKEALGNLITQIEKSPDVLSNTRQNLGNVRAHTFTNARVTQVSFGKRLGLLGSVSFAQPLVLKRLGKLSNKERKTWWEDTNLLGDGVLLCFISFDGGKCSVLFLTAKKHAHKLAGDDSTARITVQLARPDQDDMGELIRLSCDPYPGLLVELPGVIPATFLPILKNLQNMKKLGRLPFRQWLVPKVQVGYGSCPDIPPPLYAQAGGFKFSLKSILTIRDAEDLFVDANDSPEDDLLLNKIEARTTLDRGQCQALVTALTREIALIQGPPGTGKSYLGVNLMRVLLKSAEQNDLGPIIVVCYTNHALDQFLEHLIDVGIKRVIRVGGQSKSETLKGLNLKLVSSTEVKTRSESRTMRINKLNIEIAEEPIAKLLNKLQSSKSQPTWDNLDQHLEENYPSIHDQFSRKDEDGFQLAGDRITLWLKAETTTVKEAICFEDILEIAEDNVNDLSSHDRQELVEYWMFEIQDNAVSDLFEQVKETERFRQEICNVNDEVDKRVLETAQVIGLTTTGLANKIETMKHVNSKILICEEAGEIIETHMLCALLPSLEHVIAIGDHQQLRPTLNDYSLSLESHSGTEFQLDRSQFERLTMGEPGRPPFPFSQLNIQRRMRPEISTLIQSTIYPNLVDHENTQDYPNVFGMMDNVFWLDHKNLEDSTYVADEFHTSHSNSWEVEMVYSLVRHIIRQGVYSSDDIAILAPYTGQLRKLRSKFRTEYELVFNDRDEEELLWGDTENPIAGDVTEAKRVIDKKSISQMLRLATVDNFQGEEAKIVIVTLVRSNDRKNVGFLRTTNRINVLLSRAKHGLFLIGNAETYSNVPMWNDVLAILRENEFIGPAFGLFCGRHPNAVMSASEPNGFARISPEGGCMERCDIELPGCEHLCQGPCHSESMHEVYFCTQPCGYIHRGCAHQCVKECGQECGKCMAPVNGVPLPCGHTIDQVYCYMAHDAHLLSMLECKAIVKKEVPGCKHEVEVMCSVEVTSPLYKCRQPCEQLLRCRHQCGGSCCECNGKDLNDEPVIHHRACTKICGETLQDCNHKCTKACHGVQPCSPCVAKCVVKCAHRTCGRGCKVDCEPCLKPCAWSCQHQGQCTLPCMAPCDRLPCDKRCEETLKCGCRCPSLCGEECPENYCQNCSDKAEWPVDTAGTRYGDVNLDRHPIIVLGCGHFFTAKTLDIVSRMNEYYHQDKNGYYTSIKDTPIDFRAKAPRCPGCESSFRAHLVQRYGRVINSAILGNYLIDYMVNGLNTLGMLNKDVIAAQKSIHRTREPILKLSSCKLQITVEDVINLKMRPRHVELVNTEGQALRLWNTALERSTAIQALTGEATEFPSTRSDVIRLLAPSQRVILNVRAIHLKIAFTFLLDQFILSHPTDITLTEAKNIFPFISECESMILHCNEQKMFRLCVQVSLYLAKIARCYQVRVFTNETNGSKAAEVMNFSMQALEHAKELCGNNFNNAELLGGGVDALLVVLKRPRDEKENPEEAKAIDAAIAAPADLTVTGSWYWCTANHPFASGDLEMAINDLHCPECGAFAIDQTSKDVENVETDLDIYD